MYVFIRDEFTCWICQRKFDVCDLTIDHVKPVSRGGGHDEGNLRAACGVCNQEKGNKEV